MSLSQTPASRLGGTWIYGNDRKRVAKIIDVALNDERLTIAYALVTFGGWWGVPREYRALPWDLVQCGAEGELVTNLTRNELRIAPGIEKPNLLNWSDRDSRAALYGYYEAYGAKALLDDAPQREFIAAQRGKPMTLTHTSSATEARSIQAPAKPRRRMVAATRMRGSSVYNRSGERLGKIEDVAFDPRCGRVGYIVMASGGFLGFGGSLYAIPWEIVTYDHTVGANVIPDDWLELDLARAFDPSNWSFAAQARSAEIYQRAYGIPPVY